MSVRAKRLQSRLVDFGVTASQWAAKHQRGQMASRVAMQLTRSSLAPAAYYAEARHAHSRRDVLHKLRQCIRELGEAQVWLRSAMRTGHRDTEILRLSHECDALVAIIVLSVRNCAAAPLN